MGRTATRTYITPVKSNGEVESPDGTEPTFTTSRGVFTLAPGTTYYFVLPVADSPTFDIHLTHDASIIITSATLETSSHGKTEVPDHSAVAGEWIDQDPSTAFVGTKGSGTTAANGVVAVAGGSAGGANWLVGLCGAHRGRLAVVVGATGGEVRVSFAGKE